MNVQSSVISASALVNELSSVHVLMRDDMMRIVGYSKKKKKNMPDFILQNTSKCSRTLEHCESTHLVKVVSEI